MTRLFHVITITLIGWLATGSSLTLADGGLPVTPFQAHYEVFGKGLSLGEAVMSLTAVGSDGYRMNSDVKPSGLAALLASARVHEQVSGKIHDGYIQPIRYERQMDTGKKSSDVQLNFDWQANQVEARDNAQHATLPLSPGVVDPLSLNMAVMWDLQRNRLPKQYTLVDETELKTFQIHNQGEEILDTPLGQLRTVRISHSKPGNTRITTFWLALELHYLPVRIAQYKKGQEVMRMEVRTVKDPP